LAFNHRSAASEARCYGGDRLLSQTIGIKPAFEDAAFTKLVRKSDLRVRVVNRPFPQPLGRRTAAEVWRRQLRWARLRRDTFRAYFVPEVAAGAFLRLRLARFSWERRIGRWRAHSSPSLRSGMAPRLS